MSIVTIDDIKFLNNPAPFTAPYELEITFKCHEALKDDLEWKLIYVGSSTSLKHDQELDSLLVGPIPIGVNKFVFTADPPSLDLIPASEVVSVTVILLTCSYADREFVRVGYYVNNEYEDEELRDNPPNKVQIDKVMRNVLAEKPRVTYFNIEWDNGRSDMESFEQQSKLEEENMEPEEDVPDDELEDDELSEEDNEEEDNGNEEEILDDEENEENKGEDQPDEDIDIEGDGEEPDYDANKQKEEGNVADDKINASETIEIQQASQPEEGTQGP